jgi:hypothetical protein
MKLRILGVLPIVGVLFAGPAMAQFDVDGPSPWDKEKEEAEEAPPPAPEPQSFVAVEGCASPMLRLVPGSRAEVQSGLENSLERFREYTFETVPVFADFEQVDSAISCLEAHLELLANYVPPSPGRKKLEEKAAALYAKWGGQLEEFLSGDTEAAGSEDWWIQAQSAFHDLAGLEADIAAIKLKKPRERDRMLRLAREALAALRDELHERRISHHLLGAKLETEIYRLLAWSTLRVALVVHEVHLNDLLAYEDDAFAYLLRGTHSDEGADASLPIAPELARTLSQLAQVRASRAMVSPNGSLNLAPTEIRRAALEELYFLTYSGKAEWEATQRRLEAKKVSFIDEMRVEVAIRRRRGESREQIKAALSPRIDEFKVELSVERQLEEQKWNKSFGDQLAAIVEKGPDIGGN